jgi:hypothetical protein
MADSMVSGTQMLDLERAQVRQAVTDSNSAPTRLQTRLPNFWVLPCQIRTANGTPGSILLQLSGIIWHFLLGSRMKGYKVRLVNLVTSKP